MNLTHLLEIAHREHGSSVEFHELIAFTEEVLEISFDSLLQLFTNFPVFPDNARRPEVDQLMDRFNVSDLLKQKFEVVSRISGPHPDSDSRLHFYANFIHLARGLLTLKGMVTIIAGKLLEAATENPLPEHQVADFYDSINSQLEFLHSITHVVAGLIGHQVDLKQFAEMEQDWLNTSIQIDSLKLPGKIRLAASRLHTNHSNTGDDLVVSQFTTQQFAHISTLESNLDQIVEKHRKFQSEIQFPSRNGLKQSQASLAISQKVTKIIPSLYHLVAEGGFLRPNVNSHVGLAQEVLRHNFDFPLSSINSQNLKQQMDKLVTFTEILVELPGVSAHQPSNFNSNSPDGPRREPKIVSPTSPQSDSSVDILLGECRDYSTQLEELISQCQIFYSAEAEEVTELSNLSADLTSVQGFATNALNSLKLSTREPGLTEYQRTMCRSEVTVMEGLIRQSNNLMSQYQKLDRSFKLNLDHKNKVYLKNHQAMKIATWPVPKNRQGKKMNPSEIAQGFLTFLSEILQVCASPFLSNKQRLKRLAESISSPIIQSAALSQATFPGAISYLLTEFKPEKSSILVTTKGLSRLGSRNGAASLIDEYQNLLKLHRLKMVTLKSHHLLKILEKCIGMNSAQLQVVGSRLRNPSYIDELVLDFSTFEDLEQYLPQIPGDENTQNRRSQIEILLSYQVQKDNLEKFIRRGLYPETQIHFYRSAQQHKVNLHSELAFQGFFWYFLNRQMALSSQTACGLKHQLEINSATNSDSGATANNSYRNFNLTTGELSTSGSEPEEEETSSILWTQTGTKQKPKKKPTKQKKKGKVNPDKHVNQNNLTTDTPAPFPCPLDPPETHQSHKPFQCPLLQKPSDSLIQTFLAKRVCISCLNRPLDGHSEKCQPMVQRVESGRRILSPLYCERCPRVSVVKLGICVLINSKLCKCAQRRSNKDKTKHQVHFAASSGSQKATKKSNLKQSTGATNLDSLLLNATSEPETDSETENEAPEDQDCIFYMAPPATAPSSEDEPAAEAQPETLKVNTLWFNALQQEAVESDDGEQPDEVLDNIENFHFGIGIGMYLTEDLPLPIPPAEAAVSGTIDNPETIFLNQYQVGPPLLKPSTIPIFSLRKLAEELPYANNPDTRTFLLSESLDFLSESGTLVKRKAIWDSGAQKSVLNLNQMPNDCYFSEPARFSIQTVAGTQKCLDGCKSTFVITNSPHENKDLSPVYHKILALGLNFDQKVLTPDLELDSDTQLLLDAVQTRVSNYRAHHLSVILGSDCLSLWPVEIMRDKNFSLFRSKINPRRLLAFGNFEQTFKITTQKNLEAIQVNLIAYNETNSFTDLDSREFETDVELEDAEIRQIFQIPVEPVEHPFLASILKYHCPDLNQTSSSALTDVPNDLTVTETLPKLDFSDDDDSDLSWSDVSDTEPSDNDHSLPSCSTNFSNCLTDSQRTRLASPLARRQEQILHNLDHLHQLASALDQSLPSDPNETPETLDLEPLAVDHFEIQERVTSWVNGHDIIDESNLHESSF